MDETIIQQSIFGEDIWSMYSRPTEVLDPNTLIRQPAITSLQDLATRCRIRECLSYITTGENQFESTTDSEVLTVDDGATHEPTENTTSRTTRARDRIWHNVEWYFGPDVAQQRGLLEREITEVLVPLFETELPQERRLRWVLGLEPWPSLVDSRGENVFRDYEPREEWQGTESVRAELRAAEAKVFEAAVGQLVGLVVRASSRCLTGGERGVQGDENDYVTPERFRTTQGREKKAALLRELCQKLKVFDAQLQRSALLRTQWAERVATVWERMIRTHAAYPNSVNDDHKPGSIWEECEISPPRLGSDPEDE